MVSKKDLMNGQLTLLNLYILTLFDFLKKLLMQITFLMKMMMTKTSGSQN